jgi:transcriptional regulator with XRE-family HTH domain
VSAAVFWKMPGVAVGIAQSYISAIDLGQKEPGDTILFRIARLYGKSIEWLLAGSEGEGR